MNAGTAQQYARWIGALYIITIVAGGWCESHVPNTLLIANDLAGTAQRVASSAGIFRASFAAYLIEAACGHFAAWEQPKLFSEEVRAGFRSVRPVATKSDVTFAKAG